MLFSFFFSEFIFLITIIFISRHFFRFYILTEKYWFTYALLFFPDVENKKKNNNNKLNMNKAKLKETYYYFYFCKYSQIFYLKKFFLSADLYAQRLVIVRMKKKKIFRWNIILYKASNTFCWWPFFFIFIY